MRMRIGLTVVVLFLVGAALAMSPAGIPAQASMLDGASQQQVPNQATKEPPPCPMTWSRVVSPTNVLRDEEVKVQIDVTGQCDKVSQGIDVFFVVDRTLTMFETSLARPHMMERTKDALKYFVNSMDFSKSNGGLMSFASTHQVNRNLDDDQDALVRAIDRIRLSQETDVRGLQGAFRKATELIDNDGHPNNEKYIVVVVAGPDVDGTNINMPTVTQAARNAGVNVIFLMWASRSTNASYGQYVNAASECQWSRCPNWAGNPSAQRYAWTVAPNGERNGHDIDDLMNDLVNHLLFGVTLVQIEIEEAYDTDRVEFIPITPPQSPSAPPYWSAYWEYPNLGTTGIHIEYNAKMLATGTYPIADGTVMRLRDSSGKQYGPYDLNNQPVTVTEPQTPTPTTPVEPTTPVPTDTPLATEEPTATATTEGPPTTSIYLPVALKGGDW